MYLKLIGCIGIVAATSGYGYSRGLEYQKQIEEIGELRSVILQLAAEMQYTCAPLSQVCASVARRNGRTYRKWLENMANSLQDGERKRFAKIWEEECRKNLNTILIGKEEKIYLYEMGARLGSLNKRMEEQIFLQYAEFLEEKRRKLLEGISEKRRLCNLLGVTAGIFLVIMIL